MAPFLSSVQQRLVLSFLEVAVGQTSDTAHMFLEATHWVVDDALQLFYMQRKMAWSPSSSTPSSDSFTSPAVDCPVNSIFIPTSNNLHPSLVVPTTVHHVGHSSQIETPSDIEKPPSVADDSHVPPSPFVIYHRKYQKKDASHQLKSQGDQCHWTTPPRRKRSAHRQNCPPAQATSCATGRSPAYHSPDMFPRATPCATTHSPASHPPDMFPRVRPRHYSTTRGGIPSSGNSLSTSSVPRTRPRHYNTTKRPIPSTGKLLSTPSVPRARATHYNTTKRRNTSIGKALGFTHYNTAFDPFCKSTATSAHSGSARTDFYCPPYRDGFVTYWMCLPWRRI